MAKINLTIKTKGDKGETIKTSQQFEIDQVTVMQMIKLKNEISAIMKELKGNGELGSFMEMLFNEETAPMELETKEGQAQALESLKDQRFINGLAGAFDKLLDTVPDRAFNLIAILSDIDADVLKQIPAIEIADVYDAIMEENDIEKMVNRVKKSFFTTKDQWGGLIQKVFKQKG